MDRQKTLAARGLEEPCASFVIFMIFRRISDSRFTWIHDFEENWTKSVGPVLFSAEYLICRHVQTDGRIIRVGLGNLSVPPVNVVQ